MKKKQKPTLNKITDSGEFLQWYWLKEEMVGFCKRHNISASGKKFEIRDRIIAFLDTGSVIAGNKARAKTSDFDWSKSTLTLQTEITDSVTFGKNFRGFMQQHIGRKFVCHSDFMDWVRANTGKTLGEAIQAWIDLEDRKKNPDFKRKIAPQNMLAQYTRDFFNENPQKSRAEMMRCWNKKKSLPNTGGKIIYNKTDLDLL